MSSRSPYLRIADELRQELEDGRYDDGVPLPSQAELKERFGVAYMTIRSAIAVLKNEGYVQTRQGRGVYPVPPQLRRVRSGPSAEAEIDEVRTETDPVEQARKATELLQLYEVRTRALVALRKRAIDRAEHAGMKRTQIAKGMGVTKARITQIMEDAPSRRSPSARS